MITIGRWQQVKELFHAALELEEAERRRFLLEACAGDDSLMTEVLSLIDSHEQRGSFLDAPAYEVAAELLEEELSEPMKGRLIGHYRILEPLGRGGMGEIYLAEDAKLDRKVALKLLPAEWTEDAERLARFQREARAASALNHPNILTIYEIGESDGLHFIATEFIEGLTLRRRLSGALMKLEEILDVAIQIASALAAAHEAGIIHRDVKPENIMLRRDRIVKVLDFGLAKLVERPDGVNLEGSTQMLSNTHPGIVMGTVRYMSPEQARGLAVDARTDIWSLGCVFYEMVAGRPPFEGETTTDVLAAIIEREPLPISLSDSPAQLEWIIRKALRKDREERFQTARELHGDLRSLKEQLEFEARLEASVAPDARPVATPARLSVERNGGHRHADAALATTSIRASATDASLEAPSVKVKKRATVFYALAGIVALACVAAVALGVYKFFWTKKASPAFGKINITQLTSSRNVIHSAISPDGNYLAYVISDREQHSLWLRQVSASNDTLIVPPSDNGFWGITFTPDGKELYYITRARKGGTSTLYRIPVLGGAPTRVMTNIDGPVSFSPGGKQMAFVRGNFPTREESAIVIANADGSQERTLVARRRPQRFYPIYFTGPSWSPDGEWIACAIVNAPPYGAFSAFNVHDGTEKALTQQAFTQLGRIEWLRDMSGLVFVASNLFTPSLPGQVWFVSYPGGELRRVTNDLINYRGLSLTADATRLVTSSVSEISNLWIVPEGDAVRARQIAPVRSRGGLAFTPDGRIVYATETSGNWDIWIMNQDGTNRKQLTGGVRQNVDPTVSPDGRYIVYTSAQPGSVDLWRMDIDGGNAVQLTHNLYTLNASFSPDGRWIVFASAAQSGQRIMKVSVDGGEPIGLFKKPSYRPVVSPDGRWVAVFYNDSQIPSNDIYRKIAVFPFEGGDVVKTFDFEGNTTTRDMLQWTPDGQALIYNLLNDNVSNLWKQSVDGGPPVQITDFKESFINDFAYTRDGRLLVCSRGTVIREAVMISDLK